MCAVRFFEEKIVLCKKGDEITGLDGTNPEHFKPDFLIAVNNLAYSGISE
jgi:hypothetical protein